MKSLEYVKEHYDEFEEDNFDKRWTKRFLDFLPIDEWDKYGFKLCDGKEAPVVKEWTEKNILEQLKSDVEFGYEKAIDERGISSELMAMVVNTWCKVLENGLNLDGNDGLYNIRQFTKVAEHYGWKLESDYQWNDNHGELIRCINCKRFNPNAGDNKELGYCLMLGSNRVPRDGYCAWAIKREEGEEYPQVVKGAFPQ